jgi:hypothetical protein
MPRPNIVGITAYDTAAENAAITAMGKTAGIAS